jgi:hypothetical protein
MGYKTRTRRVYSAVTEDQYAVICEDAEKRGISAADWILEATEVHIRKALRKMVKQAAA